MTITSNNVQAFQVNYLANGHIKLYMLVLTASNEQEARTKAIAAIEKLLKKGKFKTYQITDVEQKEIFSI